MDNRDFTCNGSEILEAVRRNSQHSAYLFNVKQSEKYVHKTRNSCAEIREYAIRQLYEVQHGK